MNKINEQNKKISIVDIKAAISTLNNKFPQDFIDFLLETNGGVPENDNYDYIDIDGEQGSSDVLEFFALFNKNGFGIVEKTMLMRNDKRILSNHIVIGSESGGNLILCDTSTSKILLWDHDCEDNLPDNCYLIGDNFTCFFHESLYSFNTTNNN